MANEPQPAAGGSKGNDDTIDADFEEK